MATKDFKVKNGLRVGENITIDSGNIVVSGKEVISITGSITGQYAGFDSDFSGSILNTTTDSLGEGLLNLYYTTARADSAFDVRLTTKSTDNLTEGDNLYYTTARADSAFDVRLTTKSTDNLAEGDNLYYTDNRVQSYLTINDYAKLSNIDSAINALVAAAPDQLDTLNELAAAINNDSNFAGTITALIGTKVAKSEFGTYFDSNFTLKSTTNLAEGDNLYYTTTRADSAFDVRLTTKSTDNLAEGLNLYYTTTRADSAFDVRLALKSTTALAEGDNLYYTALRVDSDIRALVDSSYIEEKRPADAIFNVVNNSATAYDFTGDGFPSSSSNPGLYLQRGLTYKFKVNSPGHPFQIRASDGGIAYNSGVINNTVESGEIIFTVPMDAPDTLYYQCTIHSSMGGIIYVTEAASINTDLISEGSTNLYYTSTRVDSDILLLVDSAYIQSRQADIFRDSGFVTGIIDSAYVQSRQADIFRDSGFVTGIIDSAYVQSRIGEISGGTVDSAQTISLITATIDSAYINARIDIAGGSGGATNLNDLLDVNTSGVTTGSILKYNGTQWVVGVDNTGSGGGAIGTVDSAQTISLITNTVDSAYVQARAGDGTAIYYLSDVEFKNYKFIADSNQAVFTGIDAYGSTLALESDRFQVYVNGIRITQTDFTNNTTTLTLGGSVNNNDEVVVTAISQVSDNVAFTAGVDTFYYVATQDQTIFAGNDVNGVSLDYSPGSIQVYLNGILLIDGADYTSTNGSTLTLIDAANSGDQLYIVSHIPSNIYTIQNLVDSAYINARVVIPDAGIDSSSVTSIIDSAYINARVVIPEAGIDSATVTDIIDSAYINARVVIPEAGIDSATVTDIIDSAYLSSIISGQYLGEGTIANYFFVADSGQSTFTGLDENGLLFGYTPGNIQVFVNGVLLVTSEDYTATDGNSLDLIIPADSGDQITVNSFSAYFSSLARNYVYSGEAFFKSYNFTADSGQTIFGGSDDAGNVLSFDSDNYQVYINGFRIGSEDFTADPINNSLTLTPAALLNDEIVVTVIENEPLSTEVNDLIISAVNDYVGPSVDSYANLVFDSDYVQSKLTFNIAQSTIDFYRFVATNAQTNFTGTDAFGNTLSYRPNNASVYYNGSLLTNTLDYIATDGTSIQLALAADSGDEISVVNYNQSFIANVDSSVVTSIIDSAYINDRVVIPPSYGDSDVRLLVDSAYINDRVTRWQESTTDINAVAGQKLILDTSSVITITLPAAATLGDEIKIIDGTGNASVNNIIINRNEHLIQGNDSDLTIDIDRGAFGLVYYNTTNGWLFTEV